MKKIVKTGLGDVNVVSGAGSAGEAGIVFEPLPTLDEVICECQRLRENASTPEHVLALVAAAEGGAEFARRGIASGKSVEFVADQAFIAGYFAARLALVDYEHPAWSGARSRGAAKQKGRKRPGTVSAFIRSISGFPDIPTNKALTLTKEKFPHRKAEDIRREVTRQKKIKLSGQ